MINVQCNWDENIGHDGGQFWVSYKQHDMKAVHDKVKKNGNDIIAVDDKFIAKHISDRVVRVTHVETGHSTTCVAPVDTVQDLIPGHRITNVDVSSGGLGVVTSDGDKICVWETETGEC